MSIRTYNGCKYLNFPREGGSSTTIGDIGDAAKITEDSQHTSSSDIHVYNARVCGVSRLFKCKSYIKCRSKAEIIFAKFARCTNASCKMLQKMDMAKETSPAILMITSPDITEKEVYAEIADIEQMKLVRKTYSKPQHFLAAPMPRVSTIAFGTLRRS